MNELLPCLFAALFSHIKGSYLVDVQVIHPYDQTARAQAISMLEAERLSAGSEKGFLGGSFEDWRKNLSENKKVGKRFRYVQFSLLTEFRK